MICQHIFNFLKKMAATKMLQGTVVCNYRIPHCKQHAYHLACSVWAYWDWFCMWTFLLGGTCLFTLATLMLAFCKYIRWWIFLKIIPPTFISMSRVPHPLAFFATLYIRTPHLRSHDYYQYYYQQLQNLW